MDLAGESYWTSTFAAEMADIAQKHGPMYLEKGKVGALNRKRGDVSLAVRLDLLSRKAIGRVVSIVLQVVRG